MDKYVVVDRLASANVRTDYPDVCLSIKNGNKAVQIRLNPIQAKKLSDLLGEAIEKSHIETDGGVK